MRSGLEILAAGVVGGSAGAALGYLGARLRGDVEHRGTDAVAGFILGSTVGLIGGSFVFA